MIAPTTARLEDAVAELVAAGSGVDYNSVLSGNKGTLVPDGLFASLVLIHQAIEGIPATVMSLASDEADLNALTVATVRGRYSVQWFRTGAHNAATRLSVWVWSPEGVAQAQQADLTVLRVSEFGSSTTWCLGPGRNEQGWTLKLATRRRSTRRLAA